MSVAQIAAVVLYPRFKWKYFKDNQRATGLARHIGPAKTKLKKLQIDKYKRVIRPEHASLSPPPVEPPKVSFIEELLNRVAPITLEEEDIITTPTATRDQLFLYLEEPPYVKKGVVKYWESREAKWPQLAQMAYDFLAIPAISSECERVFLSVSKQTTLESSRLLGELLQHQEALSNWQRRGAIKLETAFNAVLLDFSEKQYILIFYQADKLADHFVIEVIQLSVLMSAIQLRYILN